MVEASEALRIGLQHHQSGRLEQAEAIYRQILQADPHHPDALHLLGVLAHHAGQLDLAVQFISRAIAVRPRVADFHAHLADALKAQGRLPEAEAQYRQALALRPDLAGVHVNMGATLEDLGNTVEAESHYRQALALRPNFAEAHYNLANLLKARSELEQAQVHYRKALELRPTYAEAHHNLGNLLREQGMLDEAVAHYRQALALRPTLAEGYLNLGLALREQGKLDEAVAHYRQALALSPTLAEGHLSLAGALELEGKTQEALESYQQALALKPNDGIRIRIATILPVIIGTDHNVTAIRDTFDQNLTSLLQGKLSLHDPVREIGRTHFYLAYHGQNDREIQIKMTQLFERACPSLLYTAPHCASAELVRLRDKIRIGFVSSFFYNHTVAHLTRGIIAKLSREIFSVTAICFSRQRDSVRSFIENHADRTIVLPSHLERTREHISAEEFDILFYPDIGMSPMTYLLAFARLAPVQCVTWGHPVTTGIRTMDYFLSSDLMEPTGGEQHYTERLIRLSRLPTYYYRPTLPGSTLNFRGKVGLGERTTLYVCPQSLFKLQPNFDPIMGAILREDPHGELILIEGSLKHWSELLMRRLQNTVPDVINRIRFLPRLSGGDFLQLLATADVILDPFHWSGGNTSYEAFAVGTPIVTLPGDFMRGRVTFACYKQMGVMDCVATSEAEYVKLAIRLGTDRTFRKEVREAILSRNRVLFEDIEVVRELESFFLNTLGNLTRSDFPGSTGRHRQVGPRSERVFPKETESCS
jgi:predicted O-linked N-acetylglucosamine transferase (SPINDLY family)